MDIISYTKAKKAQSTAEGARIIATEAKSIAEGIRDIATAAQSIAEGVSGEIGEIEESTQIEITNLLGNPGFENQLSTWTIDSGSPTASSAEKVSGVYGLNVSSSGTSSQVSKDISLIVGDRYYIGVKVKCNRYVAGMLGFQFAERPTSSGQRITKGVQKVTNGFVTISEVFTASTSSAGLYIGGLSSANLGGYVDNVILVNLTKTFGVGKELSKEAFERLLAKYENGWVEGTKKTKINNKDIYIEINKNNNGSISFSDAISAFISEMNRKTQEIGMINSSFVNPHGLGEAGQVTTAKDSLLMAIHAVGYKNIVRVWNKKRHTFNIYGINEREMTISTVMTSTNLEDYYYIFGGKTGTLTTEGYTTSNLLVIVNAHNDRWFVGSVLGADSNRYVAAKELFDIAAKVVRGENITGSDISASYGAVCLMPLGNPFAYQNFDLPLLFSKNATTVTYPASTTKIMTAMVALDYITDINELFEIKASDITSGSGPTFNVGDKISFKDALYCMLLPSSNTVATAIARVIGEKISNYKR